MCLLNPSGAKCTCPEGKVLVNGTCSDVNMSGRPASVLMQCKVGTLKHTDNDDVVVRMCVIVVPF